MQATKDTWEDRYKYGGSLLNTRAGRKRGRPLATRHTMHLVLRSKVAKGPWSFKKWKNRRAIDEILQKFAERYSVEVKNFANVGNHLHLHIRLTRAKNYRAFIRAITAAIMMKVTGVSRWTPLNAQIPLELRDVMSLRMGKFWDYRPFTRIVFGARGRQNVEQYIQVNQLEGAGLTRAEARFYVEWDQAVAEERRSRQRA